LFGKEDKHIIFFTHVHAWNVQ